MSGEIQYISRKMLTFKSIVSLLLLQGICTKPSSVAIFALARTHSFRLIKLLLFSLDSSMRCLS